MTLISVGGVAVRFGATTILDGVSFVVAPGERWGIVGRNGAGKTTIFRLITGELEPTKGSVSRATGLRVALLDQHRHFGDAATVWDAAAAGYAEAIALERTLAEEADRIAALGDKVTEADLERYGHDQERFAHLGGYEFHARVDKVLHGLGFDPEEAKTRALDSLSGGERGRVGLAGPLAAPADLLLLDEPTNHLDLDTTAWLAEYLGELGETVIVISHDRAFLDETVDHILHVHAGTAVAYRGGYSSFVTQRVERELAQQRAHEKQRVAIAKEEEYIRRNLAGRHAQQAVGRRRRLQRLPRLSAPPGEAGAMSVRLEIAERGGDVAATTEKLRVEVPGRVLVDQATLEVRRGDVVALVGPNGAGKTTFLATLLGQREPGAGSARLGGSISPGWYRQDLAGVPLDKTIYDVIADLRPKWTRGQVQGHLGAFGFSGEEVQRITNTLSGGERSRVALAMITLQRANLLVLDEPTNHLDVESIEALEDAIEEYEGTVILVSHDRAFLRELATRVWAVGDGRMHDYPGPFVDWEVDHAKRLKAQAAAESADAEAQRARDRAKAERAAAAQADERAGKRAERRRAEEAEAAVHRAEARVAELEAALADSALYAGDAAGSKRAAELARELASAKAGLDAAMAAWASASA